MPSSPPQTPPFHWHYADIDDTTTYQLRGRTLFYVVILFALILLASLLFFYARWVCSHSSIPLPQSHYHSAAVEGGHQRRMGGLDAAVIGALPVLLYGSDLVEGVVEMAEECCICLSLFEEDEKVKVLPECNHCFHSECVDRWLVSHSSCPLCRLSLRFDEQSPAVGTQIIIR